MSLENKFLELELDLSECPYNSMGEVMSNQCVQICDEFTKSFTEWKDKNYNFFYKHNLYTKRISLSTNAEVFNLTELLEIYKQGL